MTETLGPRLARKPLHLFWILDTSGSMGVNGKINALNDALRDAVPALRDVVADNPGVELLVRAVTFDHDARWHVAEPVPVERFEWQDVAVTPQGTTEMGRAIHLVTEQLVKLAEAKRGMPPALVLVSDGKPTDLKRPTLGAALRELVSETWGQKASRMAIGIGVDADMDALARFVGHDEIKPLRASNAAELAHYLRWASTVAVADLSRTGGTWNESAGNEATSNVADSEDASERPPSGPPSGSPFDFPPPDVPVMGPPPAPATNDDDLTW